MNLFDPIVEFQSEIQKIRRDIHAHPELCFEEHRTSALVADKLTEWGIPLLRGFAGTGIVGVLKRGISMRAIGLRADMDALPMQEINIRAYISKRRQDARVWA
jgi:metal-dependent amidase/aminoacylase/carboxypeptidase family protein